MTWAVIFSMFAQSGSPEDILLELERRYEKANAVLVEFVLQDSEVGANQKPLLEVRGTLTTKQPNRIALKAQAVQEGKRVNFELISDGVDASSSVDAEVDLKKVPKGFSEVVSTTLVRLGATGLIQLNQRLLSEGGEQMSDVRKWLVVSAIENQVENDGAAVISYKITFAEEGRTFDVKLWYSPKTKTLLKRVLLVKKGEEAEGTFTETYLRCALNAEVGNETFRPVKK